MAIKEMSKAKDKSESPWNSKDPEKWMWKKTCLIQHSKLLLTTPDLQKAIEEDYKGEGMERSPLDIGGPAVGKTDHRPEEDYTEAEIVPDGELSDADKEAIIAEENKQI